MDPMQRLQLANDHIQDIQREAASSRLAGAQDRPKPPRGPLALVARVGAAVASVILVTRLA